MWNIVTVGADDDGDSADPISDEQAADIDQWLSILAMEPKRLAAFWKWAAAPENRPTAIQRKDWDRISSELRRQVKASGGGK